MQKKQHHGWTPHPNQSTQEATTDSDARTPDPEGRFRGEELLLLLLLLFVLPWLFRASRAGSISITCVPAAGRSCRLGYQWYLFVRRRSIVTILLLLLLLLLW